MSSAAMIPGLGHPLLKRIYALLRRGSNGEQYMFDDAAEQALPELLLSFKDAPSLPEAIEAYFYASAVFFGKSPSVARAMILAVGKVAPHLTGLGSTPRERTDGLGDRRRQMARLLGR